MVFFLTALVQQQQQYSKFIELSLGVTTHSYGFPVWWEIWDVEKEGQREEEGGGGGGLLLLMKKRTRPVVVMVVVVVGSWGHWEWCMNDSYHG
jgi:hypothetical protein